MRLLFHYDRPESLCYRVKVRASFYLIVSRVFPGRDSPHMVSADCRSLLTPRFYFSFPSTDNITCADYTNDSRNSIRPISTLCSA